MSALLLESYGELHLVGEPERPQHVETSSSFKQLSNYEKENAVSDRNWQELAKRNDYRV